MTYSDIRPRIKSGDMLEWRSYGPLGWAIRRVTGQRVNHTSLCLAMEDAEPHKYILEATGEGIKLRLISRTLEAFRGQVWYSRLKPEYDHARAAMARWALFQVDKPYDYQGLFKNLFGRVSADAKRLFCSEFYFLALRSANLLGGNTSPRPGEFERYNLHEPPIRIL